VSLINTNILVPLKAGVRIRDWWDSDRACDNHCQWQILNIVTDIKIIRADIKQTHALSLSTLSKVDPAEAQMIHSSNRTYITFKEPYAKYNHDIKTIYAI